MGNVPTSDLDSRIDHPQRELDEVMRIQKSEKYSNRFGSEDSPTPKKKCLKCIYNHAEGRMCNACGQEGHFSRSQLCKSSRGYKPVSRKSNTRRVIEDTPTPSEESEKELYTPVSRIHSVRPSREDTVLLQWPGVVKFVPEGRPATAKELQDNVNQIQVTSGSQRAPSSSIPAKLCRAGIAVCSEKPTLPPVADTTYEEYMATVQ